jgi:hypothetical protein
MNALLFFLGAILPMEAFAQPYALPDNDQYIRIRLDAELPLQMASIIHHEASLCNALDRCIPLITFDSDLSQARAHEFRQVEYFSENRFEAAAQQLGSIAGSPFPEEFKKYSVRIKSTLAGPREISALGGWASLFLAGTASDLRDQESTATARWAMAVPFSSGVSSISFRSEITLFKVAGRNVTQEFLSSAPVASEILRRLKLYHVVFVTGTDGFKAEYLGEEYYDAFQAWLSRNGIQNTRLIPPTNRPLKEQAAYLMNFFRGLLRSTTLPKPVIFVGYSIANSNFMELLLENGPELRNSKVMAGWVANNASFLGNPLMEDVYNNFSNRLIAQTISSVEGLEDIRYVNRDDYLDANYAQILSAVNSIPEVITVSSRINSPEFPSPRQARHLELYGRGLENDGSTATFSHFIPGSDYVVFDGTDHELLDKVANSYGADPFAIYLKLFERIVAANQGPANR